MEILEYFEEVCPRLLTWLNPFSVDVHLSQRRHVCTSAYIHWLQVLLESAEGF
jgi:hypothetical protein